MTGPERVGRAIAISLLALLLFDLMGLVIKHLSARYSAAELSAYRNVFGIVPTVIALWSSRQWRDAGYRLKVRQWPLIYTRGLLVTFAQLMFYLSLGLIPFATATTIAYSGALFATLFAFLVLKERVGVARLGAVLIGFVGVILVTGLGREAFTWTALLPVAAAAGYAMSGVTARLLDEDVPSALANLHASLISVVGSGMIAFWWGGFSPIQSGSDLMWIALMGGFGGTAVLCLVISYRMTEQSNLAPFSYFGIPMAFILGWVFFAEAPIQDLFPGALLIVLGGLMVIWRERRLKQATG